MEAISVACGTRKDFFFILGVLLFDFRNSLISLEILYKQVMITAIQTIPTLHFWQDGALCMWKLMLDMDFYVRRHHSTATVTDMNNKFVFFME